MATASILCNSPPLCAYMLLQILSPQNLFGTRGGYFGGILGYYNFLDLGQFRMSPAFQSNSNPDGAFSYSFGHVRVIHNHELTNTFEYILKKNLYKRQCTY